MYVSYKCYIRAIFPLQADPYPDPHDAIVIGKCFFDFWHAFSSHCETPKRLNIPEAAFLQSAANCTAFRT